MSCQSETKSLNITNGVNRQRPGTEVQLPTASNDRLIQEKTLRDNVSVCLCVYSGCGVSLAAPSINILQKQRKHFAILNRKSPLKKIISKPIDSL